MAAAAASSSSSSSSSLPRWNYDVFLSFRGEDTRKNFVDHLYMALQQKGIYTFKDDERLERGKPISPELLKAIKESRFSIIVFSKNYASSSWCLDELAEIIACNKNITRQTVLPVFYNVDPSEVRKQIGNFGEAFAKHEQTFSENKEKVKKWRTALVEAANLSGWDLNNITNGHEAKFIQEIVQEIFKKLGHIPLSVAKYEVGIVSRVNKVINLLNHGLKNVHIVGICGAGGIGKTAIAKAVYNRIFDQFESSCFLNNVKEVSEQHGLTCLQQQLFNGILLEEDSKICNVDYGISVIRKRLRYKKVLVVLDDVDNLKQLECLAGGSDWFGFGSNIIITTRDERLLVEHKVDHEIYKVELFNEDEALQLFSWHAFTKNHPTEDYLELSLSLINYAQGLPLALQVLGSFLFKRSRQEWEHELDNLKRIPNRKIYDVLKISFDGLDDTEKDLFLDIACFFKGGDKDYVMDILGSSGFHPRISILIERNLITISNYNTLWMHDLIQDMGKEIVRQESLDDPGKRSRLWFHEDIFKVLGENMATEKIKGIMLNMPHDLLLEELHVNVDAFVKMKKLKLLKLNGVRPCGSITCLSNELCYLDWDGYPASFLPSNFRPKNLVHLRLRHSQIKQISMDIKFLEKLKFIDLSHSLYLDKTPDLSRLPCLEELNLEGCTNLVEVHHSIGIHKRLVFLHLNKCKNLKSLPRSIKLKNLKVFDLSGCSKLEKFPDIQGDMDFLEELRLEKTAIKDLPSSIEHLYGLRYLSMEDCRKLGSVPINICKLRSLEVLHFSGCLKLKKFPEIEGDMYCLKKLYLAGTGIKHLHSSIEHLVGLVTLDVSGCKKLESIPSNIFSRMKDLEDLYIGGTAIKQLPSSIVHLSSLMELYVNLNDFQAPSPKMSSSSMPYSFSRKKTPAKSTCLQLELLSGLCNLTRLDLSHCNLSEESFPDDIGKLSSLHYLILSGNNFASIPESFIQFKTLLYLYLEHCTRLRTLTSLPSSIRYVNAHGCKSLELYWFPPSVGSPDNRHFIFTGCHKLVMDQRNSVPNISSQSHLQEIGTIIFPGSEIPHWFTHKNEGSSVSLRVDLPSYNNFKGIVVCAALEHHGFNFPQLKFDLKINGFSITEWFNHNDLKAGDNASQYMFLKHTTEYFDECSREHRPIKHLMYNKPKLSPCTPNTCEGRYIEASVTFDSSQSTQYRPSDKRKAKVKKLGIHLVMEEQAETSEQGDKTQTCHP